MSATHTTLAKRTKRTHSNMKKAHQPRHFNKPFNKRHNKRKKNGSAISIIH